MKKSRMAFIAFILLLITMPMLQSCLNNDWDNEYPSLFAIGTIKVIEGNNYYFRTCFLDPFQGSVMAKFAWDLVK